MGKRREKPLRSSRWRRQRAIRQRLRAGGQWWDKRLGVLWRVHPDGIHILVGEEIWPDIQTALQFLA